MSHKSAKIAALIDGCRGRDMSPHYLGYFECFNRGLYYESHDVLEELWLTARKGPDDGFYRSLIQFAGAFVHLQNNRLRPAASLFKLSRSYLSAYPPIHQRLELSAVLGMIEYYLGRLEAGAFAVNPLVEGGGPTLRLRQEGYKP